MTTRTTPPTRRSTSASLVSQSRSGCHHRRMTSGFVKASKTAWAGARNVRWISSVCPVMRWASGGVARGTSSTRGPPEVLSPTGGAPPPGCRRRARRSCRRRRAVGVVVVPPLVRRRLRVAVGRVLPVLLAAERGDVEVGPRAAHRLVAAVVDEVRAEDVVALADEGVRAVPLVDAEVAVEVVGDRVPGDLLPAHPRLPVADVGLRRARDEHERRVARVEVREVRDLVGEERAAGAATLGEARDAGLVEEAVHDELAPAVEQVDEARRPVGPLEAVVLLDRHARHAAALGGERVAGARVLLLLHEQVPAGGLPLLRGHDGRQVHRFSLRYSSTTSNRRSQRARWRSIQSAASLITSGSSERRCVRPSTTRGTTPVSSSTFRCFVIAGFDTPNPAVASPTVAGPAASRSTISRRIGWERALNESLTTRLTVACPAGTARVGGLTSAVPDGRRLLEVVVAPEQVVADRDGGDAGHAALERLGRVRLEPLLDLVALDAGGDLVRVEAGVA